MRRIMAWVVAAMLGITITAGAADSFASTVIRKAPKYNEQGFQKWVEEFKAYAETQGISSQTLDVAMADVQYIPSVIKLDRKQLERTRTHEQYLERVVSQERLDRGREMMRTHKALLDQVSQKYGVQPRFIVALWGIETHYGKITGNFPVVDALATLAYDGRRAEFFRAELINALKILDSHDVPKDRFKGSWAGAMGQTQFMPTSFLQFAQDYDADGKRDIWGTTPDVFASIANYLHQSGWNGNETWGRQVQVPQGFDFSKYNKETGLTLAEWSKLGIKNRDGSPLPERDLIAYLATPGGKEGRKYLVYNNYKIIMKWNRSDYFATAVGIISDAIDHQ